MPRRSPPPTSFWETCTTWWRSSMACSSKWAYYSEYNRFVCRNLNAFACSLMKLNSNVIQDRNVWYCEWFQSNQQSFFSIFFFPHSSGAILTLTCSCGGSPGGIWRGHGPAQTHVVAVIQLHLQWPLMKTWAEVRFWCPMPWRSWAGQPQLPPPLCPARRPPSRPSRNRTLPVNIAIRNRGHITLRWSRGWWWRPDRARSWRIAWGAQRNCWSGSSATEACWRQTSPNQQAPVTRLGFVPQQIRMLKVKPDRELNKILYVTWSKLSLYKSCRALI